MRRTSPLFTGLAAVDTLLAATGRDGARRLTKPLLMPALLGGKPRPTQRALALGGLGDVALLGKGDAAFTAGLGSFRPQRVFVAEDGQGPHPGARLQRRATGHRTRRTRHG